MLKADHSHTPESIAVRLQEGPKGNYLKEWVYGGIDGVVTTFAIVAGVVGASLSPMVVIILGLANLIGDGFSMAAGAYSSAKAHKDNYDRLRKIEAGHVEKYPDGEREEVLQIYASKGFEGKDLEHLLEVTTRNKEHWIDFMMAEEYGLSKPIETPLKIALHTFAAFIVCGFAPLIPFLAGLPRSNETALALAALTFFAIGSGKSFWSVKSWWREGLGTMFIGLTAAGIAFFIGYSLRHLV